MKIKVYFKEKEKRKEKKRKEKRKKRGTGLLGTGSIILYIVCIAATYGTSPPTYCS